LTNFIKKVNILNERKRRIDIVSKNFKVVPISELRIKLTKIKRQVQLGHQRIVITSYGEVVGFLLPLKDLEPENGIPIENYIEMPLTQFREQLTEAGELVGQNIDCIYLTFHTRKIIAFLSSRLTSYLPIPLMEFDYLKSDEQFFVLAKSK
jgi:prevent-host-death family protein